MKTKSVILTMLLAGLCISTSAYSLRFDQGDRWASVRRSADDSCDKRLRDAGTCSGKNQRGCMQAGSCRCDPTPQGAMCPNR